MLMSMTGFGRSSAVTGTKKITAEIKSLNSKQLDLAVRLPYVYRELEPELRQRVGSVLERGKADLTVTVENIGDAPAHVAATIDVGAMAAYKKQVENAAAELGIDVPADWYSVLFRFADVIRTETPAEADAAELETVRAAVDGAVTALMEHRRAEGMELEKFFAERIDGIAALRESVGAYEGERIERIRARLEEGIAKIPAIDFDRGRLEQEMIFYIEKLDVAEEKQRLGRHLDYFRETMAAPKPGQGKKLGFIAQEMGREINTLGSKSNHAEMQATVVRMKDLLEQIKEQVLNVM